MNGFDFINTIKGRIDFAVTSYNNTGAPAYKKIESFSVEYDNDSADAIRAFFADWGFKDGVLNKTTDKAIIELKWDIINDAVGSKKVLCIVNGELRQENIITYEAKQKANATLYITVDRHKARADHLKQWYKDITQIVIEEKLI